jgi:drug/metabolite transporter (DMT)-like permease
VVFLGERLYAYHFIGAALIFSGIWLTSRVSSGSESGS